MFNRNNLIVVLLLAVWLQHFGVFENLIDRTAEIDRLSIVWSLQSPPVPSAMQADLRDMASENVKVEFIEESASSLDPQENSRMQATIQAGRDAGLPALVVSRGGELQSIGKIHERPSLKEAIE